ncbi:MAG: pyridoxamine 5'-phosphate oxidase family protein [Chloroflexi bacterium]|nr:pyridoxamine 5'-phosphate oxidase family protein [Chloroflexota bacterium]
MSSTTSEKIRQFRANPRAGVCYGSGDERQILTGHITIFEDAVIKRELWRDSLTEWFPSGADDSSICAVKFTAERATLWHCGRTVTFCCR